MHQRVDRQGGVKGRRRQGQMGRGKDLSFLRGVPQQDVRCIWDVQAEQGAATREDKVEEDGKRIKCVGGVYPGAWQHVLFLRSEIIVLLLEAHHVEEPGDSSQSLRSPLSPRGVPKGVPKSEEPSSESAAKPKLRSFRRSPLPVGVPYPLL